MARIMWMMSVSLDGFMAGPDGDLSWHHVDEEVHAHFNEVLGAMGMFLDGRVTYELMAGYWPTADEDPDSSPAEAEFARIWRAMPKVVYSRTLTEAGWGTTVKPDVVVDEVLELKATSEGDLALGGADLAATFLRHGLIDEIRLYVNPVVLGRGAPMFPPSDTPIDWSLKDTRAFGNGVVLVHLERP